MAIVCKSPAEIEKMRQSGHIVRQVLDHLRTLVAPGVTTMDLERAAEQKMKDLGATPAFKGYFDYPCVLCTSINEEIVHGIPSEKRELKAGDIVSVDCGVVMDGYYGDSAITIPVGSEITPELRKLLEVTEQSLYRGIEKARIVVLCAAAGIKTPAPAPAAAADDLAVLFDHKVCLVTHEVAVEMRDELQRALNLS